MAPGPWSTQEDHRNRRRSSDISSPFLISYFVSFDYGENNDASQEVDHLMVGFY